MNIRCRHFITQFILMNKSITNADDIRELITSRWIECSGEVINYSYIDLSVMTVSACFAITMLEVSLKVNLV